MELLNYMYMNVASIFDVALKAGIAADPRGEKGVKKYLANIKREYESLPPKEQKLFDSERLTNPYTDSGIVFDNGAKQVKRVLAGIDLTEPEVLLASELTRRGQTIDLMIAHHPVGKQRAYLPDVMAMGVDVFMSYGVPTHLAEKTMDDRMNEIGRWTHAVNHYKPVELARLLNVNFIVTHTVTDNLVDEFMRDYLASKKPETVKDILDALHELPEYQHSRAMGMGPKLFCGSPKHRVGKYILEMTGGTNPSSKVYEEFSRAGVSTLVSMHIPDESFKIANNNMMNVVIAGHMASDSLGMNLLLDKLEKQGIEIVPAGGLIRVSRNKKGKK
jgi:putative NIF3 family GTP cyclohydrolase 1 type 2